MQKRYLLYNALSGRHKYLLLSTTWSQYAARQWLSGQSAWLAMDIRAGSKLERRKYFFFTHIRRLVSGYSGNGIGPLIEWRLLRHRKETESLFRLTCPYTCKQKEQRTHPMALMSGRNASTAFQCCRHAVRTGARVERTASTVAGRGPLGRPLRTRTRTRTRLHYLAPRAAVVVSTSERAKRSSDANSSGEQWGWMFGRTGDRRQSRHTRTAHCP